MAMKIIRYGGAQTGLAEFWAILKSVIKSIRTGNWQAGEEARLLEEESAKFLGVKYGILTTSGSSAGLLALASLELPKGSEVIIPAVTFPTIFNIILQCGLVPVVVDSKVGTYNLDVDDVKRAITKKTKAIIAVHACGNPVDMPRLMKVAKKHKIYVIEDNCDGWGSSINGQKVGSFGDISITSFHAAHIVSMGVGGGIFTNNERIAKNVRMYRDWGRQANTTKPNKYKSLPKDYNPRFIYEKIGYNFQILELQAAMGRVQLRKADEIRRKRKANFDYLVKNLRQRPTIYGIPVFGAWHVTMPVVVKGADVCWFALPITYSGDRGPLVAHLEKHGIETRSMFAGNITKHPAYKNSKYRISGDLKDANYILEHSFWVSVHPRLTQKDLDYMVKVFNDFFI
jgi:CDP-6-deoxy-D-xylo-4-hexulose-3-dehydrase